MEFNETTDLIFSFFVNYCAQHTGLPPTIREIAKGTGVSSTSVVSHHLRKLVRKGRLEHIKGRYVVAGAEWYPPA